MDRDEGASHTLGDYDASTDIASPRQIDFAHQLARQIRGIGVGRLPLLAERLCGKPLDALTRSDASRLIDELKAYRAGRHDAQTEFISRNGH